MSKRMLIDGTHPEEVRVVVTSGNRLEEYDIETSTKQQIKGNIYLAKVTRVEPSLQAAFVDFGGNRHGFLAFNEIHPDYYQIPIEDRKALLAEDARLSDNAQAAQELAEEMDGGVHEEAGARSRRAEEDDEDKAAADAEPADLEPGDLEPGEQDQAEAGAAPPSDGEVEDEDEDETREAAAAAPRKRGSQRRRYKIQEVIKRRQILLVQVVKEERGNKGAALTTYLSLAGRYCVLMPNTPRGGGISRKITNPAERRKLKEILSDLEILDGMGVIMRTAGMERSKAEIKRDFEFLLRAWENVREKTLTSTAPSLVYEEASLIKRAIRDLYSKDITEVFVEGQEAYQTAKRFMRLLMPSHAKRVQPYKDETIPLFHRYQVETQLDAMYGADVQLKSGGYLVIHTTEALVAIDVNSGRSTRERNIEETALRTNIEAAEEVARQLRLRDLAGLVVIDFIDMEETRNMRRVEKVLKDAMRTDRARLQIGRISSFGLLEMSRQRLRPSLIEASTEVCPHCRGAGHIRSIESMAVRVLRALEEEGIRARTSEITVHVPTQVVLYILNQKRPALTEIEHRYDFTVTVLADDELVAREMRLERVKARTPGERPAAAPAVEPVAEADEEIEAEEETETEAEAEEAAEPAAETRKRRSRRSRKKKPQPAETVEAHEAPEEGVETVEAEGEGAAPAERAEEEDAPAKRRRRGRRGGRRRGARQEAPPAENLADAEPETRDETVPSEPAPSEPAPFEPEPAEPEPVELEPVEPEPALVASEPLPEEEYAAAEPEEEEPLPAFGAAATADIAPVVERPVEPPYPVEASPYETEAEPLNGGPQDGEDREEHDGPADDEAGFGLPAARGSARRRGWWQRLKS